ncbi:MAG: hypothetical protein HQL31_04655, partial [Planctomycetes bacterium]|nr:hypothetical protein [Planctomycetota bacterium]
MRSKTTVSRPLPVLLLLLVSSLLTGSLGAGSIEEAQALLDQKKFAEAEKALQSELESNVASAEALAIGMKAAWNEGRIVTANIRASQLQKALGNKATDADTLYMMADLAASNNDLDKATARFLRFIKLSNAKDLRMRRAIEFLFDHGLYAEVLKRYVELYGPDDQGWDKGFRLLGQLIESDAQDEVLQLFDMMMGSYGQKRYLNDLLMNTLQGATGRKFFTGDERQKTCLKILERHKVFSTAIAYNIYQHLSGVQTPGERVFTIANWQKTWDTALYPPFFDRLREQLVAHKIVEDRAKVAEMMFQAESAYRKNANREDYKAYAYFLLNSAGVFHIPGKEVVSDEQAMEILDHLVSLYQGPGEEELLGSHYKLLANYYIYIAHDEESGKKRLDYYLKHLERLPMDTFRELVQIEQGENLASRVQQYLKGKSLFAQINIHAGLLPWYNRLRMKQELLQHTQNYLSTYPGSFDPNNVFANFSSSNCLSLGEILTVLGDVLDKGGSSESMKNLATKMSRVAAIGSDASFSAFNKKVQGDTEGKDFPMATHVLLHSLNNKTAPGPVVDKFLESYKGRVPGDEYRASSPAELLAYGIFNKHMSLAWNNKDWFTTCAKAWAPRLSETGPGWDSLARRVHEWGGSGRGGILYEIAPYYVKLLKAGQKGSQSCFSYFSQSIHPAQDDKSFFSDLYPAMGSDSASAYIMNQCGAWPPGLVVSEFEKLVSMPGLDIDRDRLWQMLSRVVSNFKSDTPPSQKMVSTLLEYYLAKVAPQTTVYESLEMMILSCLPRAEKYSEGAEIFDLYFKNTESRGPAAKISMINGYLGTYNCPDPGLRNRLLFEMLAPALEQLKDEDCPLAKVSSVTYDILGEILTKNEFKSNAEAGQKLKNALDKLLLARSGGITGNTFSLNNHLMPSALEILGGTDWPTSYHTLDLLAGFVVDQNNWNNALTYHINPVTTLLEEKKSYDLLFNYTDMLIARIVHNRSQAVKYLSVIHARASREIPGQILVDKSDPAYDLYSAAQSVALGNEAHAWELTKPKLKMLQEKWTTLDPYFVVWVVDQMRKQRMLEEALHFCMTLLVDEISLDAEIAASISLVKVDIYRDMENLRA